LRCKGKGKGSAAAPQTFGTPLTSDDDSLEGSAWAGHLSLSVELEPDMVKVVYDDIASVFTMVFGFTIPPDGVNQGLGLPKVGSFESIATYTDTSQGFSMIGFNKIMYSFGPLFSAGICYAVSSDIPFSHVFDKDSATEVIHVRSHEMSTMYGLGSGREDRTSVRQVRFNFHFDSPECKHLEATVPFPCFSLSVRVTHHRLLRRLPKWFIMFSDEHEEESEAEEERLHVMRRDVHDANLLAHECRPCPVHDANTQVGVDARRGSAPSSEPRSSEGFPGRVASFRLLESVSSFWVEETLLFYWWCLQTDLTHYYMRFSKWTGTSYCTNVMSRLRQSSEAECDRLWNLLLAFQSDMTLYSDCAPLFTSSRNIYEKDVSCLSGLIAFTLGDTHFKFGGDPTGRHTADTFNCPDPISLDDGVWRSTWHRGPMLKLPSKKPEYFSSSLREVGLTDRFETELCHTWALPVAFIVGGAGFGNCDNEARAALQAATAASSPSPPRTWAQNEMARILSVPSRHGC
jgi:hypothetical protein